MAENVPNTPTGAVPPKKETGKVQPKKENCPDQFAAQAVRGADDQAANASAERSDRSWECRAGAGSRRSRRTGGGAHRNCRPHCTTRFGSLTDLGRPDCPGRSRTQPGGCHPGDRRGGGGIVGGRHDGVCGLHGPGLGLRLRQSHPSPFFSHPIMASEKIVSLTQENFAQEVLQSSSPVLVDFWAEWCGPCKMIAPILDELAEEYDGRVKFGKVEH